MKWLFKISLSISLLLLLGSNFTGAYSFNNSDKATPAFLKAHVNADDLGTNVEAKYTSRAATEDTSNLPTAEFEDDTSELRGGRKQTVKVSPADIFLAAWCLTFPQYRVHKNLHPGKLPTALALNKVYLAVQVFRL